MLALSLAVGHQHQHLLIAVSAYFQQMIDRYPDRVAHGRAASRIDPRQGLFHLPDVVGQDLLAGRSRKASSLKLTTKTSSSCGLESLPAPARPLPPWPFVAHTAAVVDHQADGNRHILALEVLIFCGCAVLTDLKSFRVRSVTRWPFLSDHGGIAVPPAGYRRKSVPDILPPTEPRAATALPRIPPRRELRRRPRRRPGKDLLRSAHSSHSPESPKGGIREAALMFTFPAGTCRLAPGLAGCNRVRTDFEFDSDLRRESGSSFRFSTRMLAAAGLLRDLRKQRRPGDFFGSARPRARIS